MQPDEKLLCSPEEKVHLEIANQADVIEFLADFVKKGRTRITESDVLVIHRLTIKGIYLCSGNFRDVTTEIKIIGTTISHLIRRWSKRISGTCLNGYTTAGKLLACLSSGLRDVEDQCYAPVQWWQRKSGPCRCVPCGCLRDCAGIRGRTPSDEVEG